MCVSVAADEFHVAGCNNRGILFHRDPAGIVGGIRLNRIGAGNSFCGCRLSVKVLRRIDPISGGGRGGIGRAGGGESVSGDEGSSEPGCEDSGVPVVMVGFGRSAVESEGFAFRSVQPAKSSDASIKNTRIICGIFIVISSGDQREQRNVPTIQTLT